MRIAALQKTTLIDFPGQVAALVFTQGCNFRCPYCHNPELTREDPDAGQGVSVEELLALLDQRKAVLQGVVFSGGEPTLQSGLATVCQQVKERGYLVKLDTNGSQPEVLERLLHDGLLDYVAMDLKSDPRIYPQALCGCCSTQELAVRLARSMELLRHSGVAHEYRSTCVAPFVSAVTFPGILEAVGQAAPLYLQAARLDRILNPSFFSRSSEECGPLTTERMEALAAMAEHAQVRCCIR